MKTIDDIIKKEIEKTGRNNADFFIPGVDMWGYYIEKGLGAVLLPDDGKTVSHFVCRASRLYQSLCDAQPVRCFTDEILNVPEKKTYKHFKVKMTEFLNDEKTEQGIIKKTLYDRFKHRDGLVYYDSSSYLFWFLNSSLMPYAVVCGIKANFK